MGTGNKRILDEAEVVGGRRKTRSRQNLYLDPPRT